MNGNKVTGKWIKNHNGDLHIYNQPGNGIVIGQNVSHDDSIKFTDRAVVIREDGSIVYQYEKDGKPIQINMTDNALRLIISTSLKMAEELIAINA